MKKNQIKQLIKGLFKKKRQEYEWEANCYGLSILHDLGIKDLNEWLYIKYREDMIHLTHFYMTGEKIKLEIPKETPKFVKMLYSKKIPKLFTPSKIKGTRNGIVIDFKKEDS